MHLLILAVFLIATIFYVAGSLMPQIPLEHIKATAGERTSASARSRMACALNAASGVFMFLGTVLWLGDSYPDLAGAALVLVPLIVLAGLTASTCYTVYVLRRA